MHWKEKGGLKPLDKQMSKHRPGVQEAL
jgi:hypothetical protein